MKKLLLLLPFVTFCFQVSATQFYWVGASGANWSVATNWKMGGFTGSVATTHPRTSSDSAYMGNGSTNATTTLDSSFSIRALFFLGSGQIFINGAGKRLTVSGDFNTSANIGTTGGGTAGIRMAGGAITGNATSEDVGKLPNLLLTGSCSLNGLITMGGSTTFYDSSATISAGTSTVVFYYNDSIKGYPSLNNVEFQGNALGFVVKDSLLVNGNLNISGSSSWTVNTGTVIALGNIAITCTGSGSYGTGTIRLAGGSSQTISSSAARSYGSLPNVVIAKTGGTLSLSGTISIAGSWTNNYSGAINAGTSEVYFKAYYITGNIGGLYPTTFYNLTLEGAVSTYNFTIDSAAIVTNLLLFEGNSALICSNYSVVVRGNVSITNTGNGLGSTTFYFKGAKNQTITSTAPRGEAWLPYVVIAKDSGTLTLSGIISIYLGWTNNYSSTQVIPGTSEVYMYADYHTIPIGGLYSTTFYNLTLEGLASTYNFTIDSAAIVTNLLTLQGSSDIVYSNHSMVIKGNIAINNTSNGSTATTAFILNGSSNQSITSSVGEGQGTIPSITIDKDGGTLTLSGDIDIYGSWINNYSGTVNTGTSVVEFVPTYGTVTFGGTNRTTFYQLLLGPNNTYNFALDSAVIVTNQLLFWGGGNIACNNYSALIKGNLQMGQTSVTNCTGSTLFYVCGTSSQNFSGYSTPTFANLIMNKPGGTFTLGEPLNISTSLTFTKGNIVSTSTDLLTINNGATVTGASDSSFVSGPIKKIGNAAFKFPLGDTIAHLYKPISISAPSTTSDAFTAQYYDNGIADGLDGVLTYTDPCEHWNMAHTTGSSTVHDTLFWNNPCFHIASLSYFKIGYVSGSTWTSVGTCTTSGNTTIGSIASTFVAGNVTLAKTNPLLVAHAGRDTSLCGTSLVTLGAATVVTGGTSPFAYSWSPATGLSNSTAANPTATPTVTTTYVLTVTDNLTEVGKDTVVVTVNPIPTAYAGSNAAICFGSGIIIGASPAASGGASPYSYSWDPSSNLNSQTIAQPTANPTTTTSYTLIVTDNNGCTASASLQVSVNPKINVNAGTDTINGQYESIHLGGTPTASGGTVPYTYNWTPSTGLSSNSIANPTVSNANGFTNAYVAVTDSLGCTGTDSMKVLRLPVELGVLNQYALLSGKSIFSTDWNVANGKIGAHDSISAYFQSTDSVLLNSGSYASAMNKLHEVIGDIKSMRYHSLTSNLNGIDLNAGIYRVSGNATLSDTLTLNGDSASYFAILINDSLKLGRGCFIKLNGISFNQVLFYAGAGITSYDSIDFKGLAISSGNIHFNNVFCQVSGYSLDSFFTKLICLSPPQIDSAVPYTVEFCILNSPDISTGTPLLTINTCGNHPAYLDVYFVKFPGHDSLIVTMPRNINIAGGFDSIVNHTSLTVGEFSFLGDSTSFTIKDTSAAIYTSSNPGNFIEIPLQVDNCVALLADTGSFDFIVNNPSNYEINNCFSNLTVGPITSGAHSGLYNYQYTITINKPSVKLQPINRTFGTTTYNSLNGKTGYLTYQSGSRYYELVAKQGISNDFNLNITPENNIVITSVNAITDPLTYPAPGSFKNLYTAPDSLPITCSDTTHHLPIPLHFHDGTNSSINIHSLVIDSINGDPVADGKYIDSTNCILVQENFVVIKVKACNTCNDSTTYSLKINCGDTSCSNASVNIAKLNVESIQTIPGISERFINTPLEPCDTSGFNIQVNISDTANYNRGMAEIGEIDIPFNYTIFQKPQPADFIIDTATNLLTDFIGLLMNPDSGFIKIFPEIAFTNPRFATATSLLNTFIGTGDTSKNSYYSFLPGSETLTITIKNIKFKCGFLQDLSGAPSFALQSTQNAGQHINLRVWSMSNMCAHKESDLSSVTAGVFSSYANNYIAITSGDAGFSPDLAAGVKGKDTTGIGATFAPNSSGNDDPWNLHSDTNSIIRCSHTVYYAAVTIPAGLAIYSSSGSYPAIVIMDSSRVYTITGTALSSTPVVTTGDSTTYFIDYGNSDSALNIIHGFKPSDKIHVRFILGFNADTGCPCLSGTSCDLHANIDFRTRCGDCAAPPDSTCYRLLGRQTYPFTTHCVGKCGDAYVNFTPTNPFDTASPLFTFQRSTYGWHSEADFISHPDTPTITSGSGLLTGNVYEHDHIRVHVYGNIYGHAEAGLTPTNFLLNFELKYPAPDGGTNSTDNIFYWLNDTIRFKDNTTGALDYTVILNKPSEIRPAIVPESGMIALDLPIPDTALTTGGDTIYNKLYNHDYSIEMIGNLEVQDKASLATNVYSIGNIRCQFRVNDRNNNFFADSTNPSPGTLTISCDPYGTPINFIKLVYSLFSNGITEQGAYSYSVPIGITRPLISACQVRYELINGVSVNNRATTNYDFSGSTNYFAGEYRPIFNWPKSGKFEFIPDNSVHNTYTLQYQEYITSNDSINALVGNPIKQTDPDSSIFRFNGAEGLLPPLDPALSHNDMNPADEMPIKQGLILIFRRQCANCDTTIRFRVDSTFALYDSAYVSGQNYSLHTVIPAYPRIVNNSNSWNLNAQEACFNPVIGVSAPDSLSLSKGQFSFTITVGNAGGRAPDHPWIYFDSSAYISAVKPDTGFNTYLRENVTTPGAIVSLPASYYDLGTNLGTFQFKTTLLNSSTCGDTFEIHFHYGYSCDDTNVCQFSTDSIKVRAVKIGITYAPSNIGVRQGSGTARCDVIDRYKFLPDPNSGCFFKPQIFIKPPGFLYDSSQSWIRVYDHTLNTTLDSISPITISHPAITGFAAFGGLTGYYPYWDVVKLLNKHLKKDSTFTYSFCTNDSVVYNIAFKPCSNLADGASPSFVTQVYALDICNNQNATDKETLPYPYSKAAFAGCDTADCDFVATATGISSECCKGKVIVHIPSPQAGTSYFCQLEGPGTTSANQLTLIARTDSALSDTFPNLCSGKYYVQVFDSYYRQEITDTVTLAPSTFAAVPKVTKPTCNLANGVIKLSVSGGVSPYSYRWNNLDSTRVIDSLSPGNYVVAITDSNGCVITDSVAVANGITCCTGTIDTTFNSPDTVNFNFSNKLIHITGDTGSILTLTGRNFLTNCVVIVDSGIVILLADSSSLTVDSSFIHGCSNFWTGIYLNATDTLTVNHHSTIQDAVDAIHAEDNSASSDFVLNVLKSVIKNNENADIYIKGMGLPAIPASLPIAGPIELLGDTFYSDNNALHNVRTNYGVYILNEDTTSAASIPIGNGYFTYPTFNDSTNFFSNFDSACIWSSRARINVFNNQFANSNCGVYIEQNKNYNLNEFNIPDDLSGVNYYNDFEDCSTGIQITSSGISPVTNFFIGIGRNKFGNAFSPTPYNETLTYTQDRAIWINNVAFAGVGPTNVDIYDNTIENFNINGVYLTNCANVFVSSNYFSNNDSSYNKMIYYDSTASQYIYYPKTAIAISNSVVADTGIDNIFYNTINNVQIGISANQLPFNYDPLYPTVAITANNINVTYDYTTVHNYEVGGDHPYLSAPSAAVSIGVLLTNSPMINPWYNGIYGNSVVGNSLGGTETPATGYLRAYEVDESAGFMMEENDAINCDFGTWLSGGVSGGSPGGNLLCNNFCTCNVGVGFYGMNMGGTPPLGPVADGNATSGYLASDNTFDTSKTYNTLAMTLNTRITEGDSIHWYKESGWGPLSSKNHFLGLSAALGGSNLHDEASPSYCSGLIPGTICVVPPLMNEDYAVNLPANNFFAWKDESGNGPNPEGYYSSTNYIVIIEGTETQKADQGDSHLDSIINFRERIIGRIMNNASRLNIQDSIRDYAVADLAYTLLNSDTGLMQLGTDKDGAYQNFYHAMDRTSIGKFALIRKLVSKGNINAARQLNDAIVVHNQMEQNRKTVYSIMFNSPKLYSVEDRETLTNLALQEPALAGDATYMARAMLGLTIPPVPLSAIQAARKENNEIVSDISIHPNPTTGIIIVEHPVEDLTITITDLSGKILLSKLSSGISADEINLSNYTSGAYLCEIKNGNSLLLVKKIILVK